MESSQIESKRKQRVVRRYYSVEQKELSKMKQILLR